MTEYFPEPESFGGNVKAELIYLIMQQKQI